MWRIRALPARPQFGSSVRKIAWKSSTYPCRSHKPTHPRFSIGSVSATLPYLTGKSRYVSSAYLPGSSKTIRRVPVATSIHGSRSLCGGGGFSQNEAYHWTGFFSFTSTDYRLSQCHFAPSKARRILWGESPRRVRVSHPPVSSLASVAEPKEW